MIYGNYGCIHENLVDSLAHFIFTSINYAISTINYQVEYEESSYHVCLSDE
jgi:hypothetical protein